MIFFQFLVKKMALMQNLGKGFAKKLVNNNFKTLISCRTEDYQIQTQPV